MSKKKKDIPVPDPNTGGLEYVCPAASWGDMTGLIPANNEEKTVSAEYECVYPYLPEYGGKSDIRP